MKLEFKVKALALIAALSVGAGNVHAGQGDTTETVGLLTGLSGVDYGKFKNKDGDLKPALVKRISAQLLELESYTASVGGEDKLTLEAAKLVAIHMALRGMVDEKDTKTERDALNKAEEDLKKAQEAAEDKDRKKDKETAEVKALLNAEKVKETAEKALSTAQTKRIATIAGDVFNSAGLIALSDEVAKVKKSSGHAWYAKTWHLGEDGTVARRAGQVGTVAVPVVLVGVLAYIANYGFANGQSLAGIGEKIQQDFTAFFEGVKAGQPLAIAGVVVGALGILAGVTHMAYGFPELKDKLFSKKSNA